MKFLAGDYDVTDVHKFKERVPEVTTCRTCRQDLDGVAVVENESQWDTDDGMTESIMSHEEDK